MSETKDQNLTPEEIKSRKEKYITFITEQIPSLELQLKYETLRTSITEMQVRRSELELRGIQIAMAMNPEPDESSSESESTSVEDTPKKDRVLKRDK